MKSQVHPQPQPPVFYQGVHPAYYYGPPPPGLPPQNGIGQLQPKPLDEVQKPTAKRSPPPATAVLDVKNLIQSNTNDIQYTPFKPKPLSLPNYASSEASFKGNFIGDGDGDNHSIISRSTGVGATYDLLVRTANPVRPASRMSQCSVSTIRETLPPPCIKPSTTYHNNISNNINAENTLRALQTSWVEQTKLLSNDQAKLLQNKTPEIPRIKLDFMPETPLPKALKDPNSGGTKRSNRSVSFDSESIAKGTKGQMQETTESTDKKQPEMTEAEDSGNKTNTILRRPQKTESIPSTKEVPNGYYGNKGIPPCILPTKLPLMSDSLYYPLNSEVSNDSHLQSDIFTANWNILLSLSVLEILLGIILATLGICRLLLLSRWGIGVELVYGVYVAVAGGLGVLGNCRKDFCLISASFVMNVLSCILALPPFILGLMATIPESFPGVKPDTFYSSHEPFAINIISSTVCLLTLIVSVVTCAQGCSMGASVFRSVPGNSTFSQHLQQYQLDYKIPTDKSTPVSSSP